MGSEAVTFDLLLQVIPLLVPLIIVVVHLPVMPEKKTISLDFISETIR